FGPNCPETHDQETDQPQKAKACADLEIGFASLTNDVLVKQSERGAPEHYAKEFPATRPHRNLKHEGGRQAKADVRHLERQSDPSQKNQKSKPGGEQNSQQAVYPTNSGTVGLLRCAHDWLLVFRFRVWRFPASIILNSWRLLNACDEGGGTEVTLVPLSDRRDASDTWAGVMVALFTD